MKRFNILGLIIISILMLFTSCLEDLSSLRPSLPDLSDKQNGTYRGEYSVNKTPVKVVLDVTVNDSSIEKIDIVEHNGSSIGKKAERIIDIIIRKQTLDVDIVSGATVSSKAILMAVEDALQ